MENLLNVRDGESAFYLFCTFFGLFFTIISFLFGATHGVVGGHGHIGHVGGHGGHAGGHAGHAGHSGTAGHANGGGGGDDFSFSISPFNISTIMIFVTWFGASGYILHNYTGLWSFIVVGLATGFGLIGGAIMYVFLSRFLVKATTPPLASKDYELAGHTATVTSTIYANGLGEITYTLHGYRRAESARSLDGQAIPRGTEVVILNYEKGIAYVQAVDAILKRELPPGETLKEDILKPEMPREVSPPAQQIKGQR